MSSLRLVIAVVIATAFVSGACGDSEDIPTPEPQPTATVTPPLETAQPTATPPAPLRAVSARSTPLSHLYAYSHGNEHGDSFAHRDPSTDTAAHGHRHAPTNPIADAQSHRHAHGHRQSNTDSTTDPHSHTHRITIAYPHPNAHLYANDHAHNLVPRHRRHLHLPPHLQLRQPPLPQGAADVQIACIFFDGVVPRSESDEYVEIVNLGDAAQDLAGWRLVDVSDGTPEFVFPSWPLEPGQAVRVYTNEIHAQWGGFSFGPRLRRLEQQRSRYSRPVQPAGATGLHPGLSSRLRIAGLTICHWLLRLPFWYV